MTRPARDRRGAEALRRSPLPSRSALRVAAAAEAEERVRLLDDASVGRPALGGLRVQSGRVGRAPTSLREQRSRAGPRSDVPGRAVFRAVEERFRQCELACRYGHPRRPCEAERAPPDRRATSPLLELGDVVESDDDRLAVPTRPELPPRVLERGPADRHSHARCGKSAATWASASASDPRWTSTSAESDVRKDLELAAAVLRDPARDLASVSLQLVPAPEVIEGAKPLTALPHLRVGDTACARERDSLVPDRPPRRHGLEDACPSRRDCSSPLPSHGRARGAGRDLARRDVGRGTGIALRATYRRPRHQEQTSHPRRPRSVARAKPFSTSNPLRSV